MKLLVIMKRFGTNKDMVIEGFGRQIKLLEKLANKHKIDFICPDYKKFEKKDVRKRNMNFYIRPYSLLMHFGFVKELETLIKKNKYDAIISSTEPLLGLLGFFYAKKFSIRHIYEMQDDFRHYDSYKIPFVGYFDRKVIKKSDVVVTVSDTLKKRMMKFRDKPIVTIQNGFNAKEFKAISRSRARKILELPQGKIIVYIGEISRLKGGDILVDAFQEVKKSFPNANLLMCGRVLDNIPVTQEGIIFRQLSKRHDIIRALYAADVGVIPNRKNIFSKYCFPNKLAEYMAAKLPIVATNLGDTAALLKKKGYLCNPDDSHDLAEKLITALKANKKMDYRVLKYLTWEALSKKLDKVITQNG